MKRHFQTLLFAVKNTFPGVGEGVICLWKWCEISINLPLRASNLKEIKFKTFPPLIPFLFLFLGRCSPEQAMDSRKEKEGSLSHLTALSRVVRGWATSENPFVWDHHLTYPYKWTSFPGGEGEPPLLTPAPPWMVSIQMDFQGQFSNCAPFVGICNILICP